MRYFIARDSLNEKIVGKDFPQAYKFIKEYNPYSLNALFSLYKYRESFPDYMPELDGIMLSGSAKLTDFVSNGFSGDLFILSDRVKQIIEQYKLCSHRFYPLGLYKRKVKYNYYLLYIVSNYIDSVDCAKTSFVEYNIVSGKVFGDVCIKSKEELFQKRGEIKKEKGISQTILGNRIVMNDLFDKTTDLFIVSRIDANLYVSERLKKAIEDNGLTGWEFSPATNLIVE